MTVPAMPSSSSSCKTKELQMNRILVAALVCVSLGTSAQISQLRTGTWEMTYKSNALPRPVIDKSCVTKADIAELTSGPDKDDSDDCKNARPPTVAGKVWSADRVCNDGRKVHAEFTAESPERVKGLITSTAAKSGGQPISVDIAGRWLNASCAGTQ
jgi:hypothetical protein